MKIEAKNNEVLHPEGLTSFQEKLSTQLFNIGAIKFGYFKLKLHDKNPEAPLSPVYIDLRIIRRFPDVKVATVDVYQELIEPLRFDLLADIPTAATPFVSSLSDRLGVGVITPRRETKNHGSLGAVDGLLESDRGKTAVLIDDLVTRADSKFGAIEILTSQGIIVKDIAVLIDRKQGGREQLIAAGFNLHSALTMDKILDFYLRIGEINQVTHEVTNQRLEVLRKFFD